MYRMLKEDLGKKPHKIMKRHEHTEHHERMSRTIKGFMLDITGVLYESGGVAVEGSVEAVNRIRKHGYKLVLVSNESTQPTTLLVDKLRKLGYSWLTIDDVITPVPAVIDVIKTRGLNPHLLVSSAVEDEFRNVVRADKPKSCIVVGDAEQNFSYENVNAAFNCLMEMQEPKLFSLGRGMYYRHNNKLRLDVGAYTCAMEHATGVTAEVVGKPSLLYFQSALQRLGLPPKQVVMVGDDLNGDVVGGKAAGCLGILVQTGKYQAAWANHPAPDFVARNLAHAVDYVFSAQQ
ncbi:HAD-superfamily hydrolase subfamily IIA [Trinorchestia longiramus]|nr:HAD-superfamily hydrolase subfamily IIA [Trinorchestia longiramus]